MRRHDPLVAKFAADVLRLVEESSTGLGVRNTRDILGHLRVLGWKDQDFVSGLYQRLEQTLQRHRIAGRIHYVAPLGWLIVTGDDGMNGQAPKDSDTDAAILGLKAWLSWKVGRSDVPRDQWLDYRAKVMFAADGSFLVDCESLLICCVEE